MQVLLCVYVHSKPLYYWVCMLLINHCVCAEMGEKLSWLNPSCYFVNVTGWYYV